MPGGNSTALMGMGISCEVTGFDQRVANELARHGGWLLYPLLSGLSRYTLYRFGDGTVFQEKLEGSTRLVFCPYRAQPMVGLPTLATGAIVPVTARVALAAAVRRCGF